MPVAGKYGQGVILRPQDYAGFGTRLAIMAVDLGVLLLALLGAALLVVLLAFLVEPLRPATGGLLVLAFFAWAGFAAAYLTALEASSWGTLGLRWTGCQVITLQGKQPSFGRMFVRLVAWSLGPVHPVFDLLYMTGDDCKQMLRDKITGTYVVRRDALVVGKGDIRPARLMVLTLNFPFWEVGRRNVA